MLSKNTPLSYNHLILKIIKGKELECKKKSIWIYLLIEYCENVT